MARAKYKGQRLDKRIEVRVSEEQEVLLKQAAEQMGVELSELWRDVIVNAARQIVVSGAKDIVINPTPNPTPDDRGQMIVEITPVKTEAPWKPVSERRESKDG